ncbi:membrane protein insertase YidC [Deferrisoma camini]|uniref:membrane protein insertase YidC n=1 Tax=Deferrisoma camini TaxID=1035120 RepID=UPI00046C930B|nr:membrane protein insertase YidC [Deferrisoma camini]
METKRTLLAVVLSMAVLVLFQYFFAPPPPKKGEPPAQPAAKEAPQATPAPEVRTPAPAAPAPAPAPPPAAPAKVETRVLENRDLRVEVSSLGAAIRRVELKGYLDKGEDGDRPVSLLASPSGLDRVGLVRLLGRNQPGKAVFRIVDATDRRVVLAWEGPDGLRVVQTYELPPEGFALNVRVDVENLGTAPVSDRIAWTMIRDFTAATKDKMSRYNFHGPAYLKDGEYEEVKLKKLEEGVTEAGRIGWAAFVDGYFLVAALPREGQVQELRVGRFQGRENVAVAELRFPAADIPPGGSVRQELRVFAGPKLREALAPLGSNLTEVVHYGFFHPVAVPLLWFLKAIYRVTGNYGVAIIVLTVLVKLIFWPLSAKSYRSMQKMKEIQPKLQRIKEKCGDDKERLNREMMQLYKTHKVNPMGGCLPMLVQIPVFFALYKVLLGSIELRHAPFFWWIQDLSAKDPYYITPLLMGATMFLQQKLTPATGANEGQMKMMMYGMPVVFTFLFLNFPSGLVLYWLVNNVLSVAQQAWMMRETRKTAPA